MTRITAVLLILLCSVILIISRDAVHGAQEAKLQPGEMRRLFEEDQKDRTNFMHLTPQQLDALNKRDAERRGRAREILAKGTIQTGEEFRFAAYIFQHGDTPEDFLLAHILAMVGISKGDSESRWIAAATLDRYLHHIKQPQVFGTQYAKQADATEWTQAPFNRDLLMESLRRELCVPSLAQQTVLLDGLNKGKPVASSRVCP